MSLIDEAIIFATQSHSGQVRKLSNSPYIVHPMEVCAILATLTDSEEVMCAGLLHDVVEDCGVDPLIIREKFGSRVFQLVMSETEDRTSTKSAEDTWMARKEESLIMLENTKDRDVKLLWLADKLSNIKSFYRTYLSIGDEMWKAFHQHDPLMHKWYYESIAKYLSELSNYPAYKEYVYLVNQVFERFNGEANV